MTGLARRRARVDGALLHQRHLLERQLHAEVAARDHDAVEGVDDRLEVVDGLRLLDLGDHRQAHALVVHDPLHVEQVVGAAHERQRDHVDAETQRPAQVGDVLLGHGRHAHGDAGQVDALVVADAPALDHAGAHAGRR